MPKAQGKKIGLVLANVPGYSETFFHNKINGLQRQGHEVVLFAGKREGKPPKGWTVVYAPEASRSNPLLQLVRMSTRFVLLLLRAPGATRRLYRLERQAGRTARKALESVYLNAHILPFDGKLDWVHFGFATMALQRENVARAIGARMATSLRGYDISIYPLKHPHCYDLLWDRLDKTHTISDDLIALAWKNGLPKEKSWQKITPAIQVEQFLAPTREFFNDGVLRILTVARLHWKKGFDYSLQAMKILKDRGIPFRYSIVGDGPEKESLLFGRYQLGLEEDVQFLGKVSHEEVSRLMAGHDLYLQPSVQEGFCNAVLEAQAAGMLCMVSNAEGLAENVLHEQTGWVVPRRRPDLLAERIINILAMDEKKRQQIRKNAVNRVERSFHLDKQIDEFLSFYTS